MNRNSTRFTGIPRDCKKTVEDKENIDESYKGLTFADIAKKMILLEKEVLHLKKESKEHIKVQNELRAEINRINGQLLGAHDSDGIPLEIEKRIEIVDMVSFLQDKIGLLEYDKLPYSRRNLAPNYSLNVLPSKAFEIGWEEVGKKPSRMGCEILQGFLFFKEYKCKVSGYQIVQQIEEEKVVIFVEESSLHPLNTLNPTGNTNKRRIKEMVNNEAALLLDIYELLRQEKPVIGEIIGSKFCLAQVERIEKIENDEVKMISQAKKFSGNAIEIEGIQLYDHWHSFKTTYPPVEIPVLENVVCEKNISEFNNSQLIRFQLNSDYRYGVFYPTRAACLLFVIIDPHDANLDLLLHEVAQIRTEKQVQDILLFLFQQSWLRPGTLTLTYSAPTAPLQFRELRNTEYVKIQSN